MFYGGGIISAFGFMPDVECTNCLVTSASLCRDLQSNTPSIRCPTHCRLLPINLDLPNPLSPKPASYDRSRKRRKRTVFPANLLPPCLTAQTSGMSDRKCSCFASTKAPISFIQVSVCSTTGNLRIAWPSPDAQVKVLTCSFDPLNCKDGRLRHLHLLPQASSFSAGHVPLTYVPPLLLHNYCSKCYSWPSSKHHPCEETDCVTFDFTSQPRPQCVFAHALPVLSSVQDLDADYSFNFVGIPAPTKHHNCFTAGTNSLSLAESFQFTDMHSLRYPALLSGRRKLSCCIHVNYLAMLQDIRASYVLWTLVSRPPQFRRHREPSLQSTVTDDTPYNSSSSLSESISDAEPLALYLEPLSNDDLTSPEDLLAHRLSGQSHTSFDLTEWEEVKPSDPDDFSTQLYSSLNGRTVAYLEEVVFDFPAEFVDEEKDGPFESNQLTIFVPPEQHDLLLVYRRLNEDLSETAYELIDAINLSTGERCLLTQRKPCDGDLSRLRELVSTCPSRMSHADRCRGLTHELNNVQMTVHSESLKMLTDLQGGYTVYL